MYVRRVYFIWDECTCVEIYKNGKILRVRAKFKNVIVCIENVSQRESKNSIAALQRKMTHALDLMFLFIIINYCVIIFFCTNIMCMNMKMFRK